MRAHTKPCHQRMVVVHKQEAAGQHFAGIQRHWSCTWDQFNHSSFPVRLEPSEVSSKRLIIIDLSFQLTVHILLMEVILLYQ